MTSADIIVRGGYVIPMDGSGAIRDGAVAVIGGKIAEVGPEKDILLKYEARKIIGGPMKAVIPGLVNTHTHAAMALMRGISDDLPLKEWLEKHIWRVEGKWLSPELVYDGTSLAVLEMIKSGITLFADMYFFEAEVARVALDMGVRAVIGPGVVDFPTIAGSGPEEYIANAINVIEAVKDEELIRPSLAIHSAYACSPKTLRMAASAARKHGALIQIHLSETAWEVEEVKSKYGLTPGMLLNENNILGPDLLAVHCVWLTDAEIRLFAEKGVSVSHCVSSNLKLASGIAPVSKMLREGVRVSLGTDGPASNNNLDLIYEMSTASKLQKAAESDPTALPAETALKMATIWGAEALGLGDVTGSLLAGKSADIAVIDLDRPHLAPIYNIYSHIAYSLRASDVETVIVNGKVIMEHREVLTADEAEIIKRAREWGKRIEGARGD